jgi:hypothetical protein
MRLRINVLSRKLFANVNSLFANESDGYKTTSAPSAFRLPAEGALGRGKSRLPSKVNAIIRNCHHEDLSHGRTARCRRCHRGGPA